MLGVGGQDVIHLENGGVSHQGNESVITRNQEVILLEIVREKVKNTSHVIVPRLKYWGEKYKLKLIRY